MWGMLMRAPAIRSQDFHGWASMSFKRTVTRLANQLGDVKVRKPISIDSLDDASYVSLMYRALLDREPDPIGLSTHLDLLQSRRTTRHEMAVALALSPEFRTKVGAEHTMLSDPRVFAGYDEKDLSIFECFKDPFVQPQPGFVTDFLGSRTRISSLWNGCETLDNRVLGLPIPGDYHADVLEWLGTLKAVLAAKNRLAVMELGAGYGPWLAVSGVAARRRSIEKMVLCGVEADPGRFAMMRQNLEDNDLLSHEVILLEAAVGISDEVVRWPRLQDPRNDAGARPFRQGNVDDANYLEGRASFDQMIDVRLVSFEELLQRQGIWDLVHIDVQGTEVELCRACLDDLSQRVRYLVVATHSRKLDGELMELMLDGGWNLEHEKPTRWAHNPKASSLIQLTTIDGTQVWRNPFVRE
jgi:FkbM family methyltransferase